MLQKIKKFDQFSVELYPLTYKKEHSFPTIQGFVLTVIFYLFALVFLIAMTLAYVNGGKQNITISTDEVDLRYTQDKSSIKPLKVDLSNLATFYMVPYQELWIANSTGQRAFIEKLHDDDLSYQNYFENEDENNEIIIRTFKNDVLIEQKSVNLKSICQKEEIMIQLQDVKACKIDLSQIDLQKPDLELGKDDTFTISLEKPNLCCLPPAPLLPDNSRRRQLQEDQNRPQDPQKMITVMLIKEGMVDEMGEMYKRDFRVLDLYQTLPDAKNTYPVFYYNRHFEILRGKISQSKEEHLQLGIYKKEDPRQGQGFSSETDIEEGDPSQVIQIKFFNRQLILNTVVQEKTYSAQLSLIFSSVLMVLSFISSLGNWWNHRQFKNLQIKQGMLETLDMETISSISEKEVQKQKSEKNLQNLVIDDKDTNNVNRRSLSGSGSQCGGDLLSRNSKSNAINQKIETSQDNIMAPETSIQRQNKNNNNMIHPQPVAKDQYQQIQQHIDINDQQK